MASSDSPRRGRRARTSVAGGRVWAVESWKDWAKSVDLEPLAIERTVYCELCGYAGTLDLYARVSGIPTVIDWKSGKAIYPEAFLQNVAYRHAADRLGLCSEQGLIVRLPKLADDPAWEVMTVPETVTLADFLAAGNLWRWQRRMDGLSEGDRFSSRSSGMQPWCLARPLPFCGPFRSAPLHEQRP